MIDPANTKPDLGHEQEMARQHGGPVAGVDEAGRGPWAGPVVAAAVVLDARNIPAGLDDSKKLSAKRRDELFEQIKGSAVVGIGISSVAVIDRDNILRASLAAMTLAVDDLAFAPSGALIDGNHCPALCCPGVPLIKGDQRSLSIAAASIIAKVTRDRLMRELAADFPQYGFEKHKGYGTKQHSAALTEHGVTKHHRRSFKPVRRIIEQTR